MQVENRSRDDIGVVNDRESFGILTAIDDKGALYINVVLVEVIKSGDVVILHVVRIDIAKQRSECRVIHVDAMICRRGIRPHIRIKDSVIYVYDEINLQDIVAHVQLLARARRGKTRRPRSVITDSLAIAMNLKKGIFLL